VGNDQFPSLLEGVREASACHSDSLTDPL
jgi:hypothetical protein